MRRTARLDWESKTWEGAEAVVFPIFDRLFGEDRYRIVSATATPMHVVLGEREDVERWSFEFEAEEA